MVKAEVDWKKAKELVYFIAGFVGACLLFWWVFQAFGIIGGMVTIVVAWFAVIALKDGVIRIKS